VAWRGFVHLSLRYNLPFRFLAVPLLAISVFLPTSSDRFLMVSEFGFLLYLSGLHYALLLYFCDKRPFARVSYRQTLFQA
jgi:hypothetical protein